MGQCLAGVPGQSATVEAQMDTRNFVGKKETVLYVTLVTAGTPGRSAAGCLLDDPQRRGAEPRRRRFRRGDRGQTPSLVLAIDRVGSPEWRAQRMILGCRIDATLVEASARLGGWLPAHRDAQGRRPGGRHSR